MATHGVGVAMKGLGFVAGGALSVIGGLSVAAGLAIPNSFRLWTSERGTYELMGNAWSLPVGAILLALGIYLIAMTWRKIRNG